MCEVCRRRGCSASLTGLPNRHDQNGDGAHDEADPWVIAAIAEGQQRARAVGVGLPVAQDPSNAGAQKAQDQRDEQACLGTGAQRRLRVAQQTEHAQRSSRRDEQKQGLGGQQQGA
ncbi:MAG: hypothetical protein ABS96_34505 [Lysobacteraceae bacterium SCN 69-123]|nr:MAG: hypothetical protein ABS96_34505 [Xanthomonadaceae bacterium SCN 69-123]